MKVIINLGFVLINVKEMVDNCFEVMRLVSVLDGIGEK